jgi:hypothetical protein
MRSRYLRTSRLLCGVALCAITINSMAPIAAAAAAAGESHSNDNNTTTPIKHVIVIIGENRTFDHLFATYQPVKAGETVLNLLSEGIVKADGTPGAKYSSVARQQTLNTVLYQISPSGKRPYTTLPAPFAPSGGFLNGGGAILEYRGCHHIRERSTAGRLHIADDGRGSPVAPRAAGHPDYVCRS